MTILLLFFCFCLLCRLYTAAKLIIISVIGVKIVEKTHKYRCFFLLVFIE